MNNNHNQIPLFLDLDGVLRIGENPAPGLKEFFGFLFSSSYSVCILSNSSLSTGDQIREFFKSHSVHCPFPIITAIDAAREYLRNHYNKVEVLVADELKHLFADFTGGDNPEAVLVGDIGEAWNYELLNDIFLKVLNGADLIAIHKNKFWIHPSRGKTLDAGPFISAIEYAASKEAVLIGKPTKLYFETALNKTGGNKLIDAIMIGDDPETDIMGIQKAGGRGVLIYTGKTSYPYPEAREIKPDFEVMDLAEAKNLLISLTE